MTNEEWATSTDASAMLEGLYRQDPSVFKKLVPVLHRYLLACCWKIKHLIPQQALRDGLVGAEQWAKGEITDEAFNAIEWYAEAEAFALDFAETPDEIEEVKTLVASISRLDGLPFEEAHQLMIRAAYFADSAMVYPSITPGPFCTYLFGSEFLCPDLLRDFIQPNFAPESKVNPEVSIKKPLFRTAFGKVKGPLPALKQEP